MLIMLHCAIIIFCIIFFVLEKKGRFYGEYVDSNSRYFSVYGVRDEERQGYFVDEFIGGGWIIYLRSLHGAEERNLSNNGIL